MTREEEIVNAAREYTDKVIFASPSTVLYFEAGAKWADEHPKNIWHDVSEMPNNHSYVMLMIDRYTIKTDYVPACLKHCQLNKSNWSEFVKNTNMKRWAYISDLLPKGGEEL